MGSKRNEQLESEAQLPSKEQVNQTREVKMPEANCCPKCGSVGYRYGVPEGCPCCDTECK